MTTLAKYDGTDLPPQFSYKLYVPKKRISVTPTVNNVVIQATSPTCLIIGDDLISWTVRSAYPYEFQTFYDWYNVPLVTNQIKLFEGYWGEQYNVIMNTLSEPEVKGRLFTFSGTFIVIEEVQGIEVDC